MTGFVSRTHNISYDAGVIYVFVFETIEIRWNLSDVDAIFIESHVAIDWWATIPWVDITCESIGTILFYSDFIDFAVGI